MQYRITSYILQESKPEDQLTVYPLVTINRNLFSYQEYYHILRHISLQPMISRHHQYNYGILGANTTYEIRKVSQLTLSGIAIGMVRKYTIQLTEETEKVPQLHKCLISALFSCLIGSIERRDSSTRPQGINGTGKRRHVRTSGCQFRRYELDIAFKKRDGLGYIVVSVGNEAPGHFWNSDSPRPHTTEKPSVQPSMRL